MQPQSLAKVHAKNVKKKSGQDFSWKENIKIASNAEIEAAYKITEH